MKKSLLLAAAIMLAGTVYSGAAGESAAYSSAWAAGDIERAEEISTLQGK